MDQKPRRDGRTTMKVQFQLLFNFIGLNFQVQGYKFEQEYVCLNNDISIENYQHELGERE